MEPTYYWDGLGLEARHWPAEHTPPGRTIVFRTLPKSWLYLCADGELPKQLAGIDPGAPLWIVRQNRPGRRSSSKAALPSPSPSWGFRSCGFSPIPEVARLGVEQLFSQPKFVPHNLEN